MPTQSQVEAARNRVKPAAIALVSTQFELEWERVREDGVAGVSVGGWVATIWAIWRLEGDEATRLVREEVRNIKQFADLGLLYLKASQLVLGRANGLVQSTLETIEGLPENEIAELYDEWSITRSAYIAEQEILGAYGWSSYSLAEQMGAREREWNTVGDSAVRETHQDADGQIRMMGEPFNVGGVAMMHPGDPSAPLVETANCRCWETYIG